MTTKTRKLTRVGPGEYVSRPRTEEPDAETIEEWMDDGGCEATDGCWVEADGTCPHGCPSWAIELGLI
jgi:hypothetical protein